MKGAKMALRMPINMKRCCRLSSRESQPGSENNTVHLRFDHPLPAAVLDKLLSHATTLIEQEPK